jgi:hypothetical protein
MTRINERCGLCGSLEWIWSRDPRTETLIRKKYVMGRDVKDFTCSSCIQILLRPRETDNS